MKGHLYNKTCIIGPVLKARQDYRLASVWETGRKETDKAWASSLNLAHGAFAKAVLFRAQLPSRPSLVGSLGIRLLHLRTMLTLGRG